MTIDPLHLPPSAFGDLLIRWNGLADLGFADWEFLPGMRFGERTAWWRDGADRRAAHEGLDLCWFRTRDGRRSSLGAGARVPTTWAGEVVAVADDFLGASVFVAHEQRDERGWRLHTVYGHVLPRPGLAPRTPVRDGDEIGVVAAPRSGQGVPPHLHLTLALVDREGVPLRLDWNAIGEKSRVCLINPMIIMK